MDVANLLFVLVTCDMPS